MATVHNAVKETIRAHLTLVHISQAYASTGTPWVAHALSHFTPVRYGRIASISTAHKTTQFVGLHKIPYAPVHNSNLLIGARRSVLNRHRRGLPPWSSEFQTTHPPSHPIFYPFPYLPRSVSNYSNHSIILLNHIGPPSIEMTLLWADFNHSSSTDRLHN
jgi:hypothetical protein